MTSSTVSSSAGLTVPVVLSGGGGSRLWPYSTDDRPKQFLSLAGPRSLFRETLDRVRDRTRFSAPVVVASARHADLCEQELLGEGEAARLILEPCARNTAAAIAMAALVVREEHGDNGLMLVMPSDHIIGDTDAFQAAVRTAEGAARAGRLVTFGVPPTDPETGYGYLHVGAELPDSAGAMEAIRFVEKPALELAETMIAGGDHLWNAGIFVFRTATIIDELEALAPQIAAAAERAIKVGACDGMRVLPAMHALADCPAQSIDYAVLEHSSRVAVVPMSAEWSDVGSWDALAALSDPTESGRWVTALDCDNCYIRSEGVEIAALGVSNLIIVATGRRLLVLPRGRSQEVKKLLAAMENNAE